MSERPKALIVGAGPTGLVMAHELARDGIQCRLIDKAPHRAMESRAIAIHSRTVETFEMMGARRCFPRSGSTNHWGQHLRRERTHRPSYVRNPGHAVSVCSRGYARRNGT